MKVEVPELEDLLRVVIAELRALRALLTPPGADYVDTADPTGGSPARPTIWQYR